MRKFACTAVLLATYAFLSSCGRSGPGPDTVSRYVQSCLPKHVVIDRLETAVFSGSADSGYRISCKGIVTSTVDLFSSLGEQPISDELQRKGFERWELYWYDDIWKGCNFGKIMTPKGTSREMRAEFVARPIVDGWSFMGYPQYDNFQGVPLGNIIVIGNKEWMGFIEQAMAKRGAFIKEREQFVKTIIDYFSPKNPIKGSDGKHGFALNISEVPKIWQFKDSGWQSWRCEFEITGKFYWDSLKSPEGVNIGNTRVNNGDTIKIICFTTHNFKSKENKQMHDAEIDLYSYREDRNPQWVCTAGSKWNGSAFVRSGLLICDFSLSPTAKTSDTGTTSPSVPIP